MTEDTSENVRGIAEHAGMDGEEQEEPLVVPFSDRVVEPAAEVIKTRHAPVLAEEVLSPSEGAACACNSPSLGRASSAQFSGHHIRRIPFPGGT